MGDNGPIISQKRGGKPNIYSLSEALAIPIPDNLESFGQITVKYFDQNVLEFLQQISGLFQKELVVELRLNSNNADVIRQLWSLLQDNIWGLIIDDASLALLRQHVSPSVLCNTLNLCKIKTTGIVPEIPNSDNENSSDSQELFKWLHGADCGRPMHLKCATLSGQGEFSTDGLEEAFRQATTPALYIFDLGELTPSEEMFGRFPMENTIGEQITLTDVDEVQDSMFYVLKRGPADERIGTMDEWGPGDLENAEHNFLILDVDDALMGHFAPL
uniref:Uncharacterized protein n=1 Tax=Globodera rostochiensis TaxID=31243 RepID=A0A914HTC6_GLORO